MSAEYIYLIQGLLTQGQSYRAPYSGYTVAFTPPSNMYFVFLSNGVVVARFPAKLLSYNENINTVNTSQCQNNLTSCNLNNLLFSLEYSSTDETNDTYTFDEVQLWADNEYMIAYASVGTTTKNANTFVRVTWDAIITIESDNVLYIPGCTNFTLTLNSQLQLNNYQPYLCLNLPYIIVALTLVPYSLVPQNTFLYTQLSTLLKILNISSTQQLQLQGVQYYVVGNTVYPISQPYIIINTQQPNTITLFLLYGINNNYFIYTTSLSVTIQYFKLYIPTLTINMVEQ
ncbi:SIFV.gp55-like protein [Sulfolobus islandicus filamentous virus 2]|uniref:SIFV.gp55-like protein n=1 Tax=Sulfolobus islandicus filamentous virus 2 TaxID=1902331 RepID=A0A1D8BJA2_SIFV|nr:SIFV.gp55-like protein [Sulfolobus islandicus filamentous virus 2]